MASVRTWRWMLAVVMITGFAMALRPVDELSPEAWFQQSDKLMHLLYFAVLWWLGRRAELGSALRLAIGFMLFAVSIEVAQALFTTTRTASVADVVGDACGLLVGAWVTGRLEAAGSGGQPEEHGG